jgi:hypothetical protein
VRNKPRFLSGRTDIITGKPAAPAGQNQKESVHERPRRTTGSGGSRRYRRGTARVNAQPDLQRGSRTWLRVQPDPFKVFNQEGQLIEILETVTA